MANGYSFPVFIQTTNKTVANTVTETSLIDGGVGQLTIPANFFTVGKTLKFELLGFHSATSNPTLRVRVKIGSVTVCDSGAVSTANSTNDLVQLNAMITCRTTGVSGEVHGHGYWQELGSGFNNFQMVNTSPVVIDTTATNTFDITVEWGTASASNTITSTNVIIWVIN